MNQELSDELLDLLAQDAYMQACELVSPNAPEFEALRERIYEELINEFEAKENPA